jgi:hypothetical protein
MTSAPAVERRLGPWRVWLGVMLLDLAMSSWVTYASLGAILAHDSAPVVLPVLLAALVIASVCGTWIAVLGRSHPTTVRAGLAVTVIRLVLLGLPMFFHAYVESSCRC